MLKMTRLADSMYSTPTLLAAMLAPRAQAATSSSMGPRVPSASRVPVNSLNLLWTWSAILDMGCSSAADYRLWGGDESRPVRVPSGAPVQERPPDAHPRARRRAPAPPNSLASLVRGGARWVS